MLIVDDEERAGDALRLMLQKFVPQVATVAVCTDARRAAALVAGLRPQILFLDIKMPHLSGFEVLQQLPHPTFKVIFTTAFNEFAIKAIRFSAFDYLLKPVDVEELMASVDRYFSEQRETPPDGPLLNNMLHNLQSGSEHFRLAIPARDGLHFLLPANIMYCEAVSNYTRFHTAEGKQFLTSKTLGDYEDLLAPHHFIRCHKSFLVNRDFVDYMDHDSLLVLKNGVRIDVSKRRKADVMKLMKGQGNEGKGPVCPANAG